MARVSNSQGLLFAEVSTEEVKVQGPPVNTLKGWFGAQQIGQIKSLITNTVIEHKGVVTHTVEDSILSSFADAQAALNAALGIQRRVAKAQNPSTGSIVKVRIGLAYGPVRVLAGKVSGDSVTAAGALLGKAPPSEILADQALMNAVGSVKDVRFEARGVMDGVTAYRVVSLAPVSSDSDTTLNLAPLRPPAAAAAAPASALVATPAPAPAPAAVVAAPAAAPAPAAVVIPPKAPAGAPTVILKHAGAERRFGPADGEVFMGRGKDVQIMVPEVHVSRKHAKIVWEEGRIPYLVNLSQNGTCVRFQSTGQEHTCMDKIRLEGGGDIALCSGFSQISSQGEIINFSLLSA